MKLRDGGIYRLPNGRELVAISGRRQGRLKLRGWERFELDEYDIDDAGRLFHQGRPTAWDINHLTDTGRNADALASS